MTYRFLPHTADICIEIESQSLEDLFQEATVIVRTLLGGDTAAEPAEARSLSISRPAPDELLLAYVRELITWFQLDTFVPASLELVRCTTTELVGSVTGEPFDNHRHEPQPEVKAITRHALTVEPRASGWRAVMVLDL